MGIRGKEDFTLERSGRGRDTEHRRKKLTQREENRWEAMKEKHKRKDDQKRNKQTGGMRIEWEKTEEEE